MIDFTADRGARVWASLSDGTEAEWIFRALTPKGYVILAGEGGRERWVPQIDLLKIDLAPVTCPDCGDLHQIARASRRCVRCESKFARTQPTPSEECEECGKPGAYYSPAARRFRCADCHALNRSNTGLFVEARVREAMAAQNVCKGQAVDDDRHQWVHMRGTRYHCRVCKTKTFVKPAKFDLEV